MVEPCFVDKVCLEAKSKKDSQCFFNLNFKNSSDPLRAKNFRSEKESSLLLECYKKDLLTYFPFELCHEKKDLKIFVVVIPKEGLAGGPPNFSFSMTQTIIYNLQPSQIIF